MPLEPVCGADYGRGRCFACGRDGADAKCSRCKAVVFCGRACQRRAWGAHKAECARFKSHMALAPSESGAGARTALPFEWARETLGPCVSMCGFLDARGVHGHNLCSCAATPRARVRRGVGAAAAAARRRLRAARARARPRRAGARPRSWAA